MRAWITAQKSFMLQSMKGEGQPRWFPSARPAGEGPRDRTGVAEAAAKSHCETDASQRKKNIFFI
jgi:hypothetical protein